MKTLRIKANEIEYELTEYVDRGYVNADLCNSVLDQTRMFLDNVGLIHRHPRLICKVYVYDDNQVNAFTVKNSGHYIIAISVGSLLQLANWFNLWTKSKAVRELFGINDMEASDYSRSFFEMAIDFLAAHEYYHVLNGHCDLPETEEYFLYEHSNSVRDKNHALFLQCLEYDADCCAVAACINLAVHNTLLENTIADFLLRLSENAETKGAYVPRIEINDEVERELIPKLSNLFFSIYGIFKLFSEADQISFLDFINDDPYKYDHPYAGVRFYAVLAMLPTILGRITDDKRVSEIIDKVTDCIFCFESEVLGIRNVKSVFFSIAVTEKGNRLLSEISNAWEYVKPRLEKYAHHPLAPFNKWLENISIVDNDGKLE